MIYHPLTIFLIGVHPSLMNTEAHQSIAARRAWRELNWLGAVSTFGLATACGVLRYTSAEWDTAQPFLLMFMGIYVAVTLLYARQSGSTDSRAVDAPLVFGVPLAGFTLQAGMVRHMAYGPAWSALGFGVAYLLLWAWLTHGVRAAKIGRASCRERV